MKTIVTAFLAATILSSCAFRPSAEDLPQASSEAQPLPPTVEQPKAPNSYVRLAWWIDAQTKSPLLTRKLEPGNDPRYFRAPLPVTLSAKVPDRIEVELTLPGDPQSIRPENVLIQAITSDQQIHSLSPKQTILVSKTPEQSVVQVELEGMRSHLNDTSEGGVELRFTIQKASGELWATSSIPFRTPPALLQITQSKLTDQDLEGLRDLNGLRKLEIEGRRFDLLQAIRVKSHSEVPIDITVPMKVVATLKVQRSWYSSSSTECGSSRSISSRPVDLTEEIRLYVLKDDLFRRATSLAPEEVAQVTKEKDLVIGVFASGGEAPRIAEGRYTPFRAGKVQVVARCESRCDQLRMAPDQFPLCWAAYEYRRGAAATPKNEINLCTLCAGGNQSACESCRTWEQDAQLWNNHGPQAARSGGPNCLFCGELYPIRYVDGVPVYQGRMKWRNEQIFAEAPSGVEDGDFYVHAEPMSALLNVRYADSLVSDDPEVRTIQFLKPAVPFPMGQ